VAVFKDYFDLVLMSATAATAADTITVVVSAKFKEPAVAAKTCID
jgi:hypothetical protein